MSYDPKNPASIFEGDNLIDFMQGLQNAYKLRHGIEGGDLGRDDVGFHMAALGDAEDMLRNGGKQ